MASLAGGVLAAVVVVLLASVLLARPPERRPARLLATALAAPVAVGGTLLVADAWLAALGPMGRTGALVVVVLAVAALAAALVAAAFVPHAWTVRALAGWVALLALLVVLARWSGLAGGVLLALGFFLGVGLLVRAFALARGGGAPAWAGLLALAVLGLLAVPGVFLTLLSAGESPGLSEARHAWTLDVAPEDEGPYVVRAPFLAADETRAEGAVDALRARLRVAEGDARVRLVENGTVVEIEGRGPARVKAVNAFYGAQGGSREAFLAMRVPDVPLMLLQAEAPARVAWSVDMSGGEGHTCWARSHEEATLAPGEARPLEAARDDGRLPVLCA